MTHCWRLGKLVVWSHLVQNGVAVFHALENVDVILGEIRERAKDMPHKTRRTCDK